MADSADTAREAWITGVGIVSCLGEGLDRVYGRQQMLAHTGALATMRSYAAQGSDPNLRRVASSAVPIIERHLQMAREMLQSFH